MKQPCWPSPPDWNWPTPPYTRRPPASAATSSTPPSSTRPPSFSADSPGTTQLPDGNKRAAWASLLLFLDLNGLDWEPGQPNVDDAEQVMFAVAAHEVDAEAFARWLDARVKHS